MTRFLAYTVLTLSAIFIFTLALPIIIIATLGWVGIMVAFLIRGL